MAEGGAGRRRWLGRAVPVVLALAVIGVVFFVVLPQFADYSDVWAVITAMTAGEIALLLLAESLNIATFGPMWMAALPGLRYRQSMEIAMTGTAIANVVPVGGAASMGLNWAMFREWGFDRASVTLALLVTGVWNAFVNLGLPVVALGFLTLRGGRNAGLEAAARIGAFALVVAVAGLVLVMRGERQARWVGDRWDVIGTFLGRALRRPPVVGSADRFSRFREQSIGLLRDRWFPLTFWTVFGSLTVFGVLWVSLRAVGVSGDEVTLTEAFAAWSITRLLTALPLTPGGLGIIELGLTASLTAFGGGDAEVVAAVLLYRFLTYFPPIVLGGLAAFTWRRHHPQVASLDEP